MPLARPFTIVEDAHAFRLVLHVSVEHSLGLTNGGRIHGRPLSERETASSEAAGRLGCDHERSTNFVFSALDSMPKMVRAQSDPTQRPMGRLSVDWTMTGTQL